MKTERVADDKSYRILVVTKQGKVKIETWSKVRKLVDKVEKLIQGRE